MELTNSDRQQIAEILDRRSNEIATFKQEYCAKDNHYGSVELALTREIDRLRQLSSRVKPPFDDQ